MLRLDDPCQVVSLDESGHFPGRLEFIRQDFTKQVSMLSHEDTGMTVSDPLGMQRRYAS